MNGFIRAPFVLSKSKCERNISSKSTVTVHYFGFFLATKAVISGVGIASLSAVMVP